MKQADFIGELRSQLSGMGEFERKEILLDYEEYFRDGKASGRSEAEIASALGSPNQIAQDMLEQYSEQVLPVTSNAGYVTKEHSGLSWFKHAWHLCKQAPLMWALLAAVFFVIEMTTESSEYYLLLSYINDAFFTYLVVLFAFGIEQNKSLLKCVFNNRNLTALPNIFLALLVWLLLIFVIEYTASVIGGRDFSLAFPAAESTWPELIFSILSGIFFSVFVLLIPALIVINEIRPVRAYQMSVIAGLQYWRQMLSAILISVAWGLALVVIVLVFLAISASITGLRSEMGKILTEEFFFTALIWFALLPLGIISYTAWAAIFRDGSLSHKVS
ncbi:DUF1700 domain-containing protein [Motilimonas cestriensis]|uniref:DUF1700 domain-containing protein n=1 Tax=Motilimonas cestriensis TaxID=2742685 RepID=A0ABS8WBL8_9GAMM|nr:DUF1700 domain-containing protein [Motilimonas cestriensis]MCE2596407.1 DUF1700 domain-containing protein [Motilimonas cestriensis]